MQSHRVKERLSAFPGATHQRLGEALRRGAPALRVPLPQRTRQR